LGGKAIAGDAGPLGLPAKLANSIERSNTLHKTYAPVDIEAVRNTDAVRLKGSRRMRSVRKGGRKYQLGIQEKYQPARATEAKSLNRWRPRQDSNLRPSA
jgi:hypothetical protein